MIEIIGILFLCLLFCGLIYHEYKKNNHCPQCGSKLDWQDRGRVDSPLGSYALKQAGYCPLCQKDRGERYQDDRYY